MTQSTVFHCP